MLIVIMLVCGKIHLRSPQKKSFFWISTVDSVTFTWCQIKIGTIGVNHFRCTCTYTCFNHVRTHALAPTGTHEHAHAYAHTRSHKHAHSRTCTCTACPQSADCVKINAFLMHRSLLFILSFGHFHRWLKHEPYRSELAEVPEGVHVCCACLHS